MNIVLKINILNSNMVCIILKRLNIFDFDVNEYWTKINIFNFIFGKYYTEKTWYSKVPDFNNKLFNLGLLIFS
jgi:hypothetical protein